MTIRRIKKKNLEEEICDDRDSRESIDVNVRLDLGQPDFLLLLTTTEEIIFQKIQNIITSRKVTTHVDDCFNSEQYHMKKRKNIIYQNYL